MLQYSANSNELGNIKYRADKSTSSKNLGNGGISIEIFDLGQDWVYLDNLVVSFVNFVSQSGTTTITNFSNDVDALTIAASNAPTNTMSGVVPNGSRFTSSADPAFMVFCLKPTARYFRIKFTNGTTVQSSTASIDVKGYTLQQVITSNLI